MSDVLEAEREALGYDVASWLWGVAQGGFNEKQTIGQILADAVIGMIPLVGDITAARDLIAVILRMARQPEKREELLEWAQLVLLVLALVPIAGGVVKGVGKLLLREGTHSAKALGEVVMFLNRVGVGDALKWVRELHLGKLQSAVSEKLAELIGHLDAVALRIQERMSPLLTPAMREVLEDLRSGLRAIEAAAERWIPEAIKELDRRLRLVQAQVYQGEWHRLGTGGSALTRELEARLVEKTWAGWKTTREMHFPPNRPKDFQRVEGWPTYDHDFWARPTEKNPRITEGKHILTTYSGPMTPRWLPPGTEINRVIQPNSRVDSFWLYELPASGRDWREDFAVLDAWSANGLYLTTKVPEQGLWVWEGKVASQLDPVSGQYLPGGGIQLHVDLTSPNNVYATEHFFSLSPRETGWSEVMGVNVPPAECTVELLRAFELAPKLFGTTARAARSASFSSEHQESP